MRHICLTIAALLCCAVGFAKDQKEIVVKTAQEFIEALGPDRTIVIDSRAPLMLTPVIEEMMSESRLNEFDYYHYNKPLNEYGLGWYDLFDGVGLSVTGFDNLTIKSKEGRKATLLITPRYADILLFERCNNLTIENIVMGHTETGSCEAGVLELYQCNHVKVNGCDLFGCGTEAIIIIDCLYVEVNDTEMHHCSYHSLHVVNSAHVGFTNCNIHDNKEYEQLNITGSRDVWFDQCNFINLKGQLFYITSEVHFYDCVFEECYVEEYPDENFIHFDGPRGTSGEEWANWIQVTGSDVNLRETPSLQGLKQNFRYKKGEYVQKLDETEEWVKIYQPSYPYGYAWIYKQYAKDVPLENVPTMVRESMPEIGLQYIQPIDMGLSVDWASANYGALTEEQYGEFMVWHNAMVEDYPDFWRLPSAAEWEELLTLPYEIVQLPSEYRVAVFTAPNGNTITIPTNGYKDEDGHQDFGFYGYYQSSTRSEDSLYPFGFIVNVPDELCRVGKLADNLWIGVRLVREKDEFVK